MSLLTHVCFAVALGIIGLGLVILAATLDTRQIAWIGFALNQIAACVYLDCRSRWRLASAQATGLRAVS